MRESFAEVVAGPGIGPGNVGSARRRRSTRSGRSEFHARSIGEHSEGFGEIDRFAQLEKRKDVAARVAAETLEELFLRIHGEGRGFFLVERAKAYEVSPLALEGGVLGDEFHQVHTLADVLFDGARITQGNLHLPTIGKTYQPRSESAVHNPPRRTTA